VPRMNERSPSNWAADNAPKLKPVQRPRKYRRVAANASLESSVVGSMRATFRGKNCRVVASAGSCGFIAE